MRAAAFLVLLAVPLAASGEDWDARCRELSGGTHAVRRAAQEALRRAAPEAEASLAAAVKSGNAEMSAAAALILAARRWDPEARLVDLEPLRGLDSGSAAEVADAVSRMAGAGSFRWEAVVGRVLATRSESELPVLLGLLSAAPARDPGWARLAATFLRRKDPGVRSAAANVVQLHGNWRGSVDLRAALAVESVPSVRSSLWRAAVEIARGPEDLPPLPDDPAIRFEVVSMMSETQRRPRMLREAWRSWTARPSAAIPAMLAQDGARVVREAGVRTLVETLEAQDWSIDLSPVILGTLADSPRRGARMTALYRAYDGAWGFAHAAALLDDPDNQVREIAEERLTDDLEAWWDDEPRVRIEKLRTLARAARIAMDIPLGLTSSGEAAWAVREIVAAGRASSSMANLAVQILASTGLDGRDALLELESDPDLGSAAANARRILELNLAGELEFEDGLDSRPWLDWYSFRLPWEAWRKLALSPDAADRWFAAALLGCAWDDVHHRAETLELLGPLMSDEDSDVSEHAFDLATWVAPELLPEEDTLRPGEAWNRPRGYTLARLGRAADSLAPLNVDTARSIFLRGDRALVLKAAWANRFATPDLRDAVFSTFEPGLLPFLVRQFESLEVTNWPAWCSHASACGPEGCRWVSAVARSADMPVRGYAIAALLLQPAGGEAAAEAISELAAMEGDAAEAALLYAVQNGGLAWRAPLPRPAADALVRATLRRATTGPPEKALSLVRCFGSQALRNATPELLAALAADPALADAAVASRAWIGDLPDIQSRMLCGPTWYRSTTLELLPGNRLTSLRSLVRAWGLAGNHREQIEPYRIKADWPQLAVAILDEAAADEPGREALLDLYAAISRYSGRRAGEGSAASMRAAEGNLPAVFDAPSCSDRISACRSFNAAPTPEAFASLCAAAFRGASGDDVALDGVASRLGPDALPRLLPLLGRPDPLVRASAATAIARAAGPASRFALAALRAAEAVEKTAGTRLRMLSALARLEDPDAVARLREMALSGDPDRRLSAVRALGFAPTRASAALLVPLTDDGDAAVREEAASALQAMTRRETRRVDPPFGRAASWKRWLEEHPDAELHDPAPAQQRLYDAYDW